MTIFDLGDLITVLVLLFLVLYFRARDSNNRSIGEVRSFLENVRNNMEVRFQNILGEMEERSVDIQAQRDLNIEFMQRGEQSYQNFIRSVEGLESAQQRLESLFKSVQHYEEELGQIEQRFGKIDRQTEQVHKLDIHLKEQRRWAAELQNHLMQKLSEHNSTLRGDFDEYVGSRKALWGEDLDKFAVRLQGLKENTMKQAEALQNVNRARTEWDKVERGLQSDAERFRQSQQSLREKLQNIMQQNTQLEDKVGARQSKLEGALGEIEESYKAEQKEFDQELERHRRELRDRLERGVQSLQQEQQALLSKETDVLMEQTVEQVHLRLQEFEQWCSAYFEKFSGIEGDIKKDQNALLEQFRNDMQQETEQMCETYREQATGLFGDWNILSENYHRLQLDFEHIENRSCEELSAQFELYGKNFAEELRRKQNKLNEHMQQWDENMQKRLEDLGKKAEQTQGENWERSREVWESQLEAERGNLKEELRTLEQQVKDREDKAEHEIQAFMAELKSETKMQQEGIVRENKERDSEIRKRVDEHGSELEQWSQKFREMEKSVQERGRKLEEQYETLEVRIRTDVRQMANNFETIEQQQQHILSSGKLIERAENLWRDTREQIAKLREQSSVLNTYAEQSRHLEKEFTYIRQLAQEVGEKLRALEASEERAEILQQSVSDIEQTLEETGSKWEALYAQNDRVQQMEEYLRRIEDVYQERGREFLALEEQAQNLETHQAQVLQHIGDMQDIQSRMSSVEGLIGPLEAKALELSHLQEVIEQNSDQTKQVVEQISLLRNLLDAAEQRTDELQKMRTWLVNAEERVKEMSENLDANIHLAEQVALQQGSVQNPGDFGAAQDLTRISDEARTMVFQLSEKGWDNATIAKQLDISVGAVELILEMSSLI
ncbi:hypothetical protein P0082_06600 [Candidatus Haliotispira prima]|uniref:Uncharacterized protein n=1 Tax=Candidatus Haliotispira prima TaxID=3034016 RepID=A0ABY8MDV2_9SPIO|nr:hypothetical protein P0082_06600 [Candidatus Haliotispira prima]